MLIFRKSIRRGKFQSPRVIFYRTVVFFVMLIDVAASQIHIKSQILVIIIRVELYCPRIEFFRKVVVFFFLIKFAAILTEIFGFEILRVDDDARFIKSGKIFIDVRLITRRQNDMNHSLLIFSCGFNGVVVIGKGFVIFAELFVNFCASTENNSVVISGINLYKPRVFFYGARVILFLGVNFSALIVTFKRA